MYYFFSRYIYGFEFSVIVNLVARSKVTSKDQNQSATHPAGYKTSFCANLVFDYILPTQINVHG